ncbi:MAG: molecular chaperone DnaJ [Clostridiales bacterium]|nr:molecular chaperone DnaJ [Clostridiales bacterium]
MAKKDYYSILEVDKQADADTIKSAYRRLAKKYHPDLYATAEESKKKEAEEKFKEIKHAYEVLSDPQKKAAYDQFGSEDGPMSGAGGFDFSGFGGGGFGDIFSDIFSSFTGGSRRTTRARNGDDIEVTLNLTFKEACFGVKDKEVTFTRIEKCPTCNGTGAKDSSSIKTCPKCSGRGRVVYSQRTPFGMMQTERVCDECNGKGKVILDKCFDCKGAGLVRKKRVIKVNIPAGVDNGQMLTMRGEGSAAPSPQGERGNLILVFRVSPHPLFVREGTNLSFELPITIFQATLGAKIDIPTLDKPVTVEIPEGTQSGTVIRVKGKGAKSLRKDTYGDLFVKIIVEVPKLSGIRERSEFKEFAKKADKLKYEKIERFNKNLRNL